jgi:group II intron reverse transcriptase/maturase
MKDGRKGGLGHLKSSRETQGKQKTSYEGYPGKIAVELQKDVGAQSVSPALERGKDRENQKAIPTLEYILSNGNIAKAYKKVVSNKGKPGIDGITVEGIKQYLHENWNTIKTDILTGKYIPKPVRRVEIPKPDGGVRLLGIPTVLDRIIQQAIAQAMAPIFDAEFSDSSYGFRPGRDAKQAILTAQRYISEGYSWVVDMDLEKYFDTVNHDILMSLVSKKIENKRVLKLIRAYLKSGVMLNGVVIYTDEGCPQGSPLSPLLSNIMLDVLDKELEGRGHKFCRYADDCNIYVKSERAGKRVMETITNFLERRLKLKVNKTKSAVDRPWNRKFLGFSFFIVKRNNAIGIRIHEKSIKKLKVKIRQILSRTNGWSMDARLRKLNQATRGWVNYFKLSNLKSPMEKLDGWIRRRIRMCIWKQWKNVRTRGKNLIKLGIDEQTAWKLANSRKGCWCISGCTILQRAINNKRLKQRGYKSLTEMYLGKI